MGGKTLMSNLALTSSRCLTRFMICFVLSWQGGGLQKWKPLTLTPEPQRYNHSPMFTLCSFSLLLSSLSSLHLPPKLNLVSQWKPLIHSLQSVMMAAIVAHDNYLRVVMNFHVFCCPCMRDAVLTSTSPTDPCTVHLAVTSRCWRTQTKSCAAGRDVSLCHLDKDAHGREESRVGHKHLVDLLDFMYKMQFYKWVFENHYYNEN